MNDPNMSTSGASQLAKFMRPRLPSVLPRQRLFDWFDEVPLGSGAWICGPAGSGKTMLAANYVSQQESPNLWYQLDEGDSDVGTLFYYLTLGLEQAGYETASLPRFASDHHLSLSLFARRFFEQFYSCFRPPFVLVLDDYHLLLPSATIHEVIREALDVLPDTGRLLIASREAPPEMLARHQANQYLRVLGWPLLRLDEDEVRFIATSKLGRQLSSQELVDLQNHAAGWMAGLIMLLQSDHDMVQIDRDPASLPPVIESDGTRWITPQPMFDYFASEYFNHQNQDTRTFLLKMGFLPRATAAMAVALTGNGHAIELLQRLYRSHFLIEYENGTSNRYVFHPLLREFLMARAKEMMADEAIVQTQRRAAELLESDGQTEEAFAMYVRGCHWGDAVRMICQLAPMMSGTGQHQALMRWIGSVPSAVFDKTPWLGYWSATCMLPIDPVAARRHFTELLESFVDRHDVAGVFSTWAGIAMSVAIEWNDYSEADPWIERLDQLLEQFSGPLPTEVEAFLAASALHCFNFRCPQRSDISRWVQTAHQLMQNCGDANLRLWAGQAVLLHYLWAGEQQKANLIIEQLRPDAQSNQVSPSNQIVWHGVEAMHASYLGRSEHALERADLGLHIANESGIHGLDCLPNAHAVHVLVNHGRLDEAKTRLAAMEKISTPTRKLAYGQFTFLLAHATWLEGDLAQAASEINIAVEMTQAALGPHIVCLLTASHIALERDRFAEARDHLDVVAPLAEMFDSDFVSVQCDFAEALLGFAQGKTGIARKALQRGLVTSEANGYVMMQSWHPRMMVKVCAHALQEEIEVGYAQTLIRQWKLKPPDGFYIESWPWPVKIFGLRPFELVIEGKPLNQGGKTQKRSMQLIQALVAFGGQLVSQEKLMDTLWSEVDADAAYRSLKTAVHRLRKLLGHEQAIVWREGRLGLDSTYCWTDVFGFEQGMEELKSLDGQAGLSDRTAERFQVTLELYQSPFLSCQGPLDWARTKRKRLHQQYLQAVGTLCEHWVAQQRWEQVIDTCEAALSIDSHAESMYQILIQCYEQQGKPSESLAVFDRCQAALQR